MTSWTFTGTVLDGSTDADDHVVVGDGSPAALPGRFAVAGLVDAHSHPSVLPGSILGDRAATEARLREYAALGVTVVRDLGGNRAVTLALGREPSPGLPLVVPAGRFLSAPDRYFPQMYTPTPADRLVEAIEAEVTAGATWVKIIGDFPRWGADGPIKGTLDWTYDADTLRRAVDAAHAAGARVAVHSNLAADGLIAMGVDSVEHGTGLVAEDVAALGARGGAWTPTLSAVLRGLRSDDPDRRRHAEELSERVADVLVGAIAGGVRVLAGTDVEGTIATEIAQLVRHGLTVDQALDAAGPAARDFLGTHPQDDLVTYEADPREDPEVLASPAAVVVRGVRVR